MARSGLVTIALLPQNVLVIKAVGLNYWKMRCMTVRNLVPMA
jgi:hypothetical protein